MARPKKVLEHDFDGWRFSAAPPRLKWVATLRYCMPTLACPDCGREVAMRELDTRTVARPNGFETTYCCPFCRSDVEDVGELL